MEFQPVRARSIAICCSLTGLSPHEIGFLPFLCPGGPKKEQNQWCAAACIGVARGTMPKRQPSVSRRRVLHSDDPPNAGHQRWVIVDPLGVAATVVLARALDDGAASTHRVGRSSAGAGASRRSSRRSRRAVLSLPARIAQQLQNGFEGVVPPLWIQSDLGLHLKDQMVNLSWNPEGMALLLRRGPTTRPVQAIPELRREGESVQEQQ